MKRKITALLSLCGLLQCTQCFADENPYASIVSRNIFGLLPISEPATNSIVSSNTIPILTCNGIMTIFGKKEVLFKAKLPSETNDTSYILAEGETSDNIVVISIDTTNALITFLNNGEQITLSLVSEPSSTVASQPQVTANPQPGEIADVKAYDAQASFLERIRALRKESEGLPSPMPPVPLQQ